MKRFLITVVLCMLVSAGSAAPASAATVYNGSISSTYLDIFRAAYPGSGDYVVFRSGQYSYTMWVGDLTLQGSTFTLSEGDSYVITTNTGDYGQSGYSYRVTSGVSDFFVTDNYLVFSNLGDFPVLLIDGGVYDYALLAAFCVFGCCCLVRPLFSWVLRVSGKRGGEPV